MPINKEIKVVGIISVFKEAYEEMVHKVTWPTWAQLQSSSILVLTASVIIALIIFLMDYIFGIQEPGGDGFQWRGILGFIYQMISGL